MYKRQIQGYAAPGAEYDYITDTGSKIVGIDTITPATIRIGIDVHMDLTGLGVFAQSGGASAALDARTNTIDEYYGRIERCTFFTDTTTVDRAAVVLARRCNRILRNNLFISNAVACIRADERGSELADAWFQSNTLIQGPVATVSVFQTNAGSGWTNRFENNVLFSEAGNACVQAGEGANFTSVANNATSDAVTLGAGTGQQVSITTADFEDYAGGNYKPAAAGKLDGTGFDNSADYTDDILGNTRTQWDIGAYATDTGTPPLQSNLLEGGLFTTLAGGVSLNLTEISVQQTLSDVEITQAHNLSLGEITSGQTLSDVTVTQAHNLTLGEISQAQTLAAVSLISGSSLTLAAMEQAQSLDDVELTQAHSLSIGAITQQQTLDTVELTQAHLITLDPIGQLQNLSEVDLLAAGVLVLQAIEQGQTLSDVQLTQEYQDLILSPIDHNHQLTDVGLGQSVSLLLNAISQAQTLSSVSVTTADILQLAEISQSQILEQVQVNQAHVLVLDEMTQEQILESVRLGGLVVGLLEGELTIILALDGDLTIN